MGLFKKIYRKLTRRRISFIKPYWDEKELILPKSSDLPEVDIEELFTKRFNIIGRAFAVSSGRTAIKMMLQVLKTENPGRSKVIIPTYACRGVFDPVINSGLIPVLADVEKNLLLSSQTVIPLLDDKTLAVIVPHLCGAFCHDLKPIYEECQKQGIVVIEDVCQAVGVKFEDEYLGNYTDCAVFSFGIGKNLMATGGGILVSKICIPQLIEEYQTYNEENAKNFAARYTYMCNQFMLSPYEQAVYPQKEFADLYDDFKMTIADKYLLACQLEKADKIVACRRSNSKKLINAIKKSKSISTIDNIGYVKFPLICDGKKSFDDVISKMSKFGVELEGMYTPLHQRDFASNYKSKEKYTIDGIYPFIINVPVRPNLTYGDVNYVRKIMRNIIKIKE